MRSRLAAVLLVSASGLLFQFAQTRLFSATLSYHLTFLVVSGALLGVAGAGTAAAIIDHRPRRPSTARLALSAAVATIVALAVETQVDPLVVGMFPTTATAYLLGVVPVLFGSWIVVRALRESPAKGGTIYAADLAGAALGGVSGYVFIGVVGDQGLYGLCAALCLVAAAVGLVVSLSAWGEIIAPPRPGPLKSLPTDIAGGMIRDTARWDPLARVDVLRWGTSGDSSHYAFLIDQNFVGPRPASLAVELDMGALTPILSRTSSTDLAALDASVLSAPYALAQRHNVLVIGPGGGIDVLTALQHGSESVVAVEVNRTVVDLMRGRYAAYSGSLYMDPRVDLVEDEARSFVRRSAERYDLIVMTVVDSFSALSNGAYALTEGYLYTDEAMYDYLNHLSAGGAVAVARWYRDPPSEIVRTFAVARDGLLRHGVANPEQHIAVLKYQTFGLLIIGERAFTSSDMDRLQAFASGHGFEVAYDPGHPTPPFTGVAGDDPVTDDRPFFFDATPLSAVLAGKASCRSGTRS
jgi:hypothetical protein